MPDLDRVLKFIFDPLLIALPVQPERHSKSDNLDCDAASRFISMYYGYFDPMTCVVRFRFATAANASHVGQK